MCVHTCTRTHTQTHTRTQSLTWPPEQVHAPSPTPATQDCSPDLDLRAFPERIGIPGFKGTDSLSALEVPLARETSLHGSSVKPGLRN